MAQERVTFDFMILSSFSFLGYLRRQMWRGFRRLTTDSLAVNQRIKHGQSPGQFSSQQIGQQVASYRTTPIYRPIWDRPPAVSHNGGLRGSLATREKRR